MAKGSKLKAALENFKGVDKKVEHQKAVQKAGVKNAEKRKRAKLENEEEDAILEGAVDKAEKKSEKSAAPPAKKSKKNKAQRQAKRAQLAAVAVEATLEDLEDESEDEEPSAMEVDTAEKEWETDEEEEHTLAVCIH